MAHYLHFIEATLFYRQIMTADYINVLINDSDWAWPQAARQIFSTRGIQLLLVKKPHQALDVLQHRRVHTAILDTDCESSGLTIIKMIRSDFPLLPCILLARTAEEKLLSEALNLDVFSVMNKPVDFELLQNQLHKLFLKKYGSMIFA